AEDVFWHNLPFKSEDDLPVDPNSFEVLRNPLSKDRHHVYYKQFHVEGFDPDSFMALEAGYGKDAHQIFDPYFWQNNQLVPQDVASFEVINYTYTKDKDRVYM